jgi:hypothetical protein
MVNRWINIGIIGLIILCSTSFYKFSILGPLQKGSELMGPVIIIGMIILYAVYSDKSKIRHHFSTAILLMILSLLTSMVTAYFVREQSFIQTMFAQRALYYYLLYFLLHQIRIEVKDIEKMIIFFALIYIGLHYLQTVSYPTVLFDGSIFAERGTIRVYLPGAHYISIAFYLYLQRFLRSNRMKYILFMFLIVSVFILRAGRQPLAILVLTTILFVLFDRKVKSRFLLILLGVAGAFSLFLIFQGIFQEILLTSRRDVTMGDDYIRLRSARYYLTDFFESTIAYITGNGMYHDHSAYGMLMKKNNTIYHYHIGDIGLLGNYVIYGPFFILGVIIICVKALKTKIESEYTYVKYFFLAVIISLIAGGAFANSDFICLIVMLMYVMDVSNRSYVQQKSQDVQSVISRTSKYAGNLS